MRIALLSMASAIALLLAPPAAGAAERPVPGCLGTNFEDPAGDPREANSGLDVTGGFLTVRDGTPVVNVSFEDLDLEAYPQPDDLYKTVWVAYTVGGTRATVQATFNRIGSQGYQRDSAGTPSRRIRGMAHPGPGGVVEMDLPGLSPDATITLETIRTESYKAGGVEFEPDENATRRTMDLAEGTSQSLSCPEAAPAPSPSPSPTPSPSPEPSPAPAPQPSTPAPQPPAQPAPAPAAPRAASVPRTLTFQARRLRGARARVSGRAEGVRDGARLAVLRGERVVARTTVRDGRFSVIVRRARRGTRLRVRVDGLVSAPVRVR